MAENGGKSVKANARLMRQSRKTEAEPNRIIAYDLETTNIRKGTPKPVYLTAFSEAESFSLATRIESIAHLREVLIQRFLTPQFNGCKFVAWNGNHFDCYFIAAALIQESGYVIKPFLTRSKNLRGMMVMRADELNEKGAARWYFLDGMAMLGLMGMSLEKFLSVFAPDYRKLKEAIDFETQSFDPDNPIHRDYAMRDSEGLYYGITRAESIMLEYFNQPLHATMGAACIRILIAHIPESVVVNRPDERALDIIRRYVTRGGYCFCVGKYHGPVWKYDINQAYAAAMREARLPAGDVFHCPNGLNRYAKVFIARIEAYNLRNRIPFYYKTNDHRDIPRAVFSTDRIHDTWITSIEYYQLLSEGWKIDVKESYFFDASFSLRDYVNKLERLRSQCEGGPSGPIGTMIKAVGNHSYGKTLEQFDGINLLIAKDCPEGYAEYFPAENEEIYFPHVWYKHEEKREREYQQPQIGAFITAHVRMVVRRAALIDPGAWLYADTDCVVFSRDVTAAMDIDPKRYGAFKLESAGEVYRIIAKKVYASADGKVKHAKGLNVKRLDTQAFEAWYDGIVPVQEQVQRQNFVKTMAGADMFMERVRSGTRL
jgi:hypothetical protein